ncbi:MAG TPA: hypothetical protein VGD52_14560 [Pseudoduganella sp.]
MKKKTSALARAKTEAVLRTYGFNAASDDLFFVRIGGGLVQSIFYAKTRYKDQYNVVCSLIETDQRLGEEGLLFSSESRERISGAPVKFALSPIAPFQNTYSWTISDEIDALASLEEIIPLLETMALPVFAKVDSSSRLRQVQEPDFDETAGRMAVDGFARELSSSGFRPSDGGEFLWKRNGELFAILLPSVVGFGCFLQVHVLLWSPLLHGTVAMPDVPPSNFSRVSFACLTREGLKEGGVDSLWPIDIDGQKIAGLDGILAAMVHGSLPAWLQQHQTVASLLQVVSDDLRPYVRREIEAARESCDCED